MEIASQDNRISRWSYVSNFRERKVVIEPEEGVRSWQISHALP
jgi:hypothetical protein